MNIKTYFTTIILCLALMQPAHAEQQVCDGTDSLSGVLCWGAIFAALPFAYVVHALSAEGARQRMQKSLDHALAQDDPDRLDTLMNDHPELFKDRPATAIAIAGQAQAGRIRSLRWLLDHVTANDDELGIALEQAHDRETAQLLVEHGARLDPPHVWNLGARMNTISFDEARYLDVLDVVFNASQPPSLQSPEALNLISTAAYAKRLSVVEFLLAQGMSPEGWPGSPPLVNLLRTCQLKPSPTCVSDIQPTMAKLLQAHADVNSVSVHAKEAPLHDDRNLLSPATALDVAMASSDEATVNWLCGKEAKSVDFA
jgi:hypothetical protein